MKTIILIACLFAVSYAAITCVGDQATQGNLNFASATSVTHQKVCDELSPADNKPCGVSFTKTSLWCQVAGCKDLTTKTPCEANTMYPCFFDDTATPKCAKRTCASELSCLACSLDIAGTAGDKCKAAAAYQGLGCVFTTGNYAVADKWPCNKGTCAKDNCIACGPLKGADAAAKTAAQTACEKVAECQYASDKCTARPCDAANCGICANKTACTASALNSKCSWDETNSKCANATTNTSTADTAKKSSAFVKGLPVLSMIILAICLLAEF